MRRKNSQNNRISRNSFVCTTQTISFSINFISNIVKIEEFFVWEVSKFSPFGVSFFFVELENDGTTGDDS